MPVYHYRTKEPEPQLLMLRMTIDQMQRCTFYDDDNRLCVLLDDGREAMRDLGAEHGGFTKSEAKWPLYSEAAGVHPSQIDKAREQSVRLGVPTDFTADGRAVFTDPSHRRRYCRAVGVVDLAGYD